MAYCCVGWNLQQVGKHITEASVDYAKGYFLYFEDGSTCGVLDT
jgi:hypothetical protein